MSLAWRVESDLMTLKATSCNKDVICNNQRQKWTPTLQSGVRSWLFQKEEVRPPQLNSLKPLTFFPGWLCSAPSPCSRGNCCHLQVQQILRRKCVKPRVLCRGWKWRQATPMKNDGSFKRQLSYLKQATLTTMCCLTLPFTPSVFFCSSLSFPLCISISGMAREDLWDWGK